MVAPAPLSLFMPSQWQVPLIVSAPHSGTEVPTGFPMPMGARGQAIMAMNDTNIHTLALPAAAQLGFPVLSSRYIRAFIDLNRSPDELDPKLIEGLPYREIAPNPQSRLAAGLGLIPRLADGQQAIYDSKISLAAVQSRIRRFYDPYHQQLSALVSQCLDEFGHCLLIDLHSMPPIAPAAAHRALALTPGQPTMRQRLFTASALNVVLGDDKGGSLDAPLASNLTALLQAKGLTVSRNRPYAGGWITQSYGSAGAPSQSLQLEICRGIYPGSTPAPHAKALEVVFMEVAQRLAQFGLQNTPPPKLAAE